LATAEEVVLKILGDARGLTSELDKSKSSLTKFGDAVKKGVGVAAKAAAVGLTALATGAAVALKAYREQEKQEQKVRQVIEATGKAAGVTAEQVFKMASSLQEVTTFGDEAILEAQSIILTFREISGDVLPRTTEAVLNMAAVMGTDAKSAAIQLGKAMNDPAGQLSALSRVGIKFSKDQELLIKGFVELGEVSKAQSIILEELDKEFGGVARQLAQGTGVFEQLKNASGDLVEEIGKNLAPEAIALSQYFLDIVKSIQENQAEFLKYKAITLGSVAAVSSVIGSLIEIFGNLVLTFVNTKNAIVALFTDPFSGAAQEFIKENGRLLNDTVNAVSNIGENAGEAYTKEYLEAIQRNENFLKDQQKAIRLQSLREENQALLEEQERFLAELREKEKEDKEKKKTELELLQEELLELKTEYAKAEATVLEELELEHLIRLQKIRNDNRKKDLAEENGYLTQSGDLNAEQQAELINTWGTFGKKIVDVDNTLGKSRVDLQQEGLSTIQDAFNAFGVKNVEANKAFQITQILISAASDGFKAFASQAGQGLVGLILGIANLALIGAQAGIAISKVSSARYSPRGLAAGSSGGSILSGEKFFSSFSGREIVVPESFSQGIRRGDLTLSGPEDQAEQFGLEIRVSDDIAHIVQIAQNEQNELNIRRSTF